VKRDRSARKRERLARVVERATLPERPFMGSGPRYLVHPSVAAACAPSLLAIAAALHDEARRIDDASLRALERFITDGSSAFFGYSTTTALWATIRLEDAIVGEKAGTPGEAEIAVAVAV
jgi:hypothetical protein